MTKSPHPSSVDKGELLPVTVEDLKARGYLVVDARNPLVVSGWIVYLPGVTDHVLIAASEAAAWDMAREHSKQAHPLPGVGMREALATALSHALYGADFDPFAEPEKWDFAEKVAADALTNLAGEAK